MKPFEPNLSTLAIARDVLLTPFGLDESILVKSLGAMFTHRVDYADMYFQFTKSEGWSLEEGIVKTGSFSIDQGVGVRAVSGDKTAFSYSDEISERALLEAAAATRTIARQGAGKVKVASSMQQVGGRSLYLPNDPLASLDATAKVKLLERVEKMARAKDPRVVQVMAGLGQMLRNPLWLIKHLTGRPHAGARLRAASRHGLGSGQANRLREGTGEIRHRTLRIGRRWLLRHLRGGRHPEHSRRNRRQFVLRERARTLERMRLAVTFEVVGGHQRSFTFVPSGSVNSCFAGLSGAPMAGPSPSSVSFCSAM